MLRTSKAAAWFHSVPYDYSLASTGYEPGTEPVVIGVSSSDRTHKRLF